MTNDSQIKNDTIPKQNRPPFFKWLGLFIILIILLITAGAIYESIAERSDSQAYPPPGKLVDVGGYHLHIHCTGHGSPTVVIESGWGDFSSSWGWVQPEVAKTTRVCTYDRAGTGWSEPSPQPRTAREFAKELHSLLANANEHGPYVLVGHSLGAYTIRIYAHDYPNEVAGLVLIDPQNLSTSDNSPTTPAPIPGGNSLLVLLARIGIMRLLAGPLGSIQDLPLKDKEAYAALSVTPRFIQTFLDEGSGMSEGAAQARSITSLGALPLIVLSRGKGLDAQSADSQKRYLQLSTNSQQFFAKNSGHRIMIEQPEAAISAIVKMVELVRK